MPLEPAVQGDAGAKNGMVRSHRFLGANTALPHLRGDAEQERRTLENLRGRASLALLWSGPARVDALMRARGVGHRFPGGTMDSNEVWLEVTALDAAGKVIAVSGGRGRDGALDGEAHLVRAQPVDERGAPLTRRDPQHQRGIAFDAALTPSDPQVVRYEVPTRHGARAGALLYRKFTAAYAAFACADLPAAVRARCLRPADRRDRHRRDRGRRAAHRRSGHAGRLGDRARGRDRRPRRGSARAAGGGAREVAGPRRAAARPGAARVQARSDRRRRPLRDARRVRASPITRRRSRWRRARCSTPTVSRPRARRRTAGPAAARRSHRARAWSRARAASPATRRGARRGRRPAGDRSRIRGRLLPALARARGTRAPRRRRTRGGALRTVPRLASKPTSPCATAGGACIRVTPTNPSRATRTGCSPCASALVAPRHRRGVRRSVFRQRTRRTRGSPPARARPSPPASCRSPSARRPTPPAMVAALDDQQGRRRGHARAHGGQLVERAERIATPLHEQDRRPQREQHLVAHRARRARLQRIPEADDARDGLLQREVAADTPAHRFADQEQRPAWRAPAPRPAPRGARRSARAAVGRLPPRAHVRIVERDHVAQRRPAVAPRAHPRR